MKSIYDWMTKPGMQTMTTDSSQAMVPPTVKPGNSQVAAARSGYAQGGVVSPQGGQTPPAPSDTVPMQGTPGEFVIPQPVVQFLGQKFFKELIERAQAEMGQEGGETNPFTEMSEDDEVMPQGYKQGGPVSPYGR